MSDGSIAPPANPAFHMGFKELVSLIAGMMALGALAIDAMLPALPYIGESLRIVEENQRQWIVTSFLLGMGIGQLFWGVLADRFGRRRVLIVSLVLYSLFSAAAALAGSFALMMAARVLQGIAAAATRVVALSIVRDRFESRQMARVMSLTFIVFLVVPILAPSLGQLILLIAPWRWIFGVLAATGLIILLWSALRLPETLHPEYRHALSWQVWANGWRAVLTERMSFGYSVAQTLLMGSLFGFITCAQQIFADVFHMSRGFPLMFAVVAAAMAVGSYLNSRIVERLGTRKVSHTALIGFVMVTTIHVAVAVSGHETVWSFSILQAMTMICFALAGSNFGAMAMAPLGHIAGMAASAQGFMATIGGSLLGFMIAQQFNGTTVPVTLGFMSLGIAALVVVFLTERGRLFQALHPSEHPLPH